MNLTQPFPSGETPTSKRLSYQTSIQVSQHLTITPHSPPPHSYMWGNKQSFEAPSLNTTLITWELVEEKIGWGCK